MTGLKLLSAAAILSAAVATPAMAQEATQEPAALGQAHPYVDYLTGGYGVRGTSRGQYGPHDRHHGAPDVAIGIAPGSVTPTAPGASAYYTGSAPGPWFIGEDGVRHLCR